MYVKTTGVKYRTTYLYKYLQGRKQMSITALGAVEKMERMRKRKAYHIIEQSKSTRQVSWSSRTGTSMSVGSSDSVKVTAGKTQGRWCRPGLRRR